MPSRRAGPPTSPVEIVSYLLTLLAEDFVSYVLPYWLLIMVIGYYLGYQLLTLAIAYKSLAIGYCYWALAIVIDY
jgi:hypothetical protein